MFPTRIKFRQYPHAPNKSEHVQNEWHYQPAWSTDCVNVKCNSKPRNASGKQGYCRPSTLHTHFDLRFAQIKSHTAARCPPGLYGDLHKRYYFSFPHSCTGALCPLRGPGSCSGLSHRPMLVLFHHILWNRRALGYRQEERGVSQGTLPMPQLMLPAPLQNRPIPLWQSN